MSKRRRGGATRTRGESPRGTPWSAEDLVELAVRHNLAELEVEAGGTRIRVVRERTEAAVTGAVRAEPPAARGQPLAEEATASSNLVTIEAPIVGTFYRASGPAAPPFVSEGDVVKEGQILCIIEAMKLMNEIEAKAAGRIAKVLVENAQPVEYGQPLFLVEPLR